MMRRDEGGGRKGEGNARTEEDAVMFITHTHPHDDVTIKDWRYDHAAVAGGRMSKSEYQIPGAVGMTLAETAGGSRDPTRVHFSPSKWERSGGAP
jgi:hypothetical protein